MDSQKFNLCWNEYGKAASETLKNLITDQEFTDVTLTCDDDDQIHAHKIVLSSSSPVFRRMLLKNPHQHPLIHLRGVSTVDLKGLSHKNLFFDSGRSESFNIIIQIGF